ADTLITVSKAQKRLFKHFPEMHDRIRVIHNGVDVQRFMQADGNEFRRDIGVSPGQFLYGMVGPVSRHKGVEEFIRAAATIVRVDSEARFAVVGPDRPRAFLEEMKALVHSLQVEQNVIFTGFRDDIPEVMSGLDVLVTPSRVEAFGRVLLEAMAAGTPVIASQVGGIPEVISERDMGILVPPKSAEKLGEAMLVMLQDTSRRNQIIQVSQAHVARYFTIEKHTREIEMVYEAFLSRSR
ncbi:glycosyltransferase family 4 protein, partial [bacterium]|nr:glycosyltransferase family 4 protein [candidate division CSSED10-310 bacterium]